MALRLPVPWLPRPVRLAAALLALAALAPTARLLPDWLLGTIAGLAGLGLLCHLRDRRVPAVLRIPLTIALAAGVLFAYRFQFGRDTGAALLAMMLTLKLFELDHLRDLRSVVGFALFALMASFLNDQGPWLLLYASAVFVFGIAVLGALARLDSPDAAAGEFRPLPASTPSTAPRFELNARTEVRRAAGLTLAAIPVAVALFFLFPRLASPLWGMPGLTDDAATGLSDDMSPGDIATLSIDDSPVMRVEFFGARPSPDALYWRGPVMGEFDGRRWSRSRTMAALPAEPLAAIGAEFDYEITLEPTEQHYVPALELPTAAAASLLRRHDHMLAAPERHTRLTRYRLRSAAQFVLDPQLSPVLQRVYTRLPADFNPRTQSLIRQWQAEGLDGGAIAQRLLADFYDRFRYTLRAPLLGRNSVDDFLFESQAGYCEHFASAFAVAMRMAGVPARIATGYQGGYWNAIGGHLVVRNSDAHAWTELWFPGRGWVRVDPTQAVAPERIEQGRDGLADRGKLPAWLANLRDSSDQLRRMWNRAVLGFDARRQRQLFRPLGFGDLNLPSLTIAMIVSVALASVIIFAVLWRRPKGHLPPLVRAWRRFARRLEKHGGPPRRLDEDPLEFVARAAEALPADAALLQALGRRFSRARYGPAGAAAADRQNDARPAVEPAALIRDLRGYRPRRR